jgi:hypothetical protein
MARYNDRIRHNLTNFTVDFEATIDIHGRPDDRFVFESRSKTLMSVRVREMADILNGLIEIEKMEREHENRKCFAYSKEIASGTNQDSKFLIATRIGGKLKVRLVEFDSQRQEDYTEFAFDLYKDDVFDLCSFVLRTLNYHSAQLQIFFCR